MIQVNVLNYIFDLQLVIFIKLLHLSLKWTLDFFKSY